MTRFNPDTHIVGKVYDLTQENFQAVVAEVERLRAEIERLRDTKSALAEQNVREGVELSRPNPGASLLAELRALRELESMVAEVHPGQHGTCDICEALQAVRKARDGG